MNQTVFDTKQKAQELLDEALSIWRQGNHSDQLEGLKDDPVFQLLMSAVAYQSNITGTEIERLKEQVLDEFVSLLVPYDAGHATPASTVISTMPSNGLGEVMLDSADVFALADAQSVKFIPVLRTRVLGAHVTSVARLDGRRWEVTMNFDAPISDLSYAAFAINDHGFRDLHVYVSGKELPLVRPWEYSELPFSEYFSLEHESYNGTVVYDPSMSVMDVFAIHDLRVFCVRRHSPKEFIPEETTSLKFELEFEGTSRDFTFERAKLVINPVVLVNVSVGEVTLDSRHPIASLTGSSSVDEQLVQVLKPGNDQMYSDVAVSVRRIAADRFNQNSLLRLLLSMLGKIHTDYYAFSRLNMEKMAPLVDSMESQLQQIMSLVLDNPEQNISGTYVMLDNSVRDSKVSVSIKYITTPGARYNSLITEKSRFLTPGDISGEETVQIVPPKQGTDEIDANKGSISSQAQYFIQTGNRIVTPSDIRKFCFKELSGRYGITSNVVSEISVRPQQGDSGRSFGNACGYEIAVRIRLSDTPYVRRIIGNKIPQAELLLEKMMQVRSANIYPIVVTIEIG